MSPKAAFLSLCFSKQIRRRICLCFALTLVIITALPVRADDKDAEEDDMTLEQKFIQKNIELSDWIDTMADGLDMFLVGRRLTNRRNESSVRFENLSVVKEREGYSNSTSTSVNLRLPNLEEYWQLKFTSYDERRERRRPQNEVLRQTTREQNYGATLGLFRKLGNIRTAFQPRIDLQDPLKISHSLTFESVADNEGVEINPKVEFFGTPDEGVGASPALNFRFKISDVFAIALINNSEYLERTHVFDVTDGISLEQSVNERSALSYALYVNSNNQPSYHMESYSFSITLSQLIYKKILDYNVSPQLIFAKTTEFIATPAITFSLNLTF